MTPTDPEYGGPRNWKVTCVGSGLNLRQQPSTRARILTVYPSVNISDFA